jgi:hypothetical protein
MLLILLPLFYIASNASLLPPSLNYRERRRLEQRQWDLLERDSLLPEGGRPKHLLWALHFMKVYPKQSPGCSAVGASAGAVNSKTHRKWVWAFIDAVTNLIDVVVSNHSVGTGAGVM